MIKVMGKKKEISLTLFSNSFLVFLAFVATYFQSAWSSLINSEVVLLKIATCHDALNNDFNSGSFYLSVNVLS